MLPSILHRMIFWELVKVFALSLLAITGILVVGGVVKEAPQHGFGIPQVLMLIWLLIPETLPFTVPTTLLFATCVVYGRLSHDNEILAIRASGINLLKVVWPGVILGTAMSIATMGLYYRVIPYTQNLLRTLFIEEAEDMLYAMLRNDREINLPNLNYVIFVRGVQGYKLMDPIFKRRDKTGNYDLIVCARTGELRVDLPGRRILVRMHDGELSKANAAEAHFKDQIWEIPLPQAFGKDHQYRPGDMTWEEIQDRRHDVVADEDTITTIINKAKEQLTQANPPPDLALHLRNLEERRRFIHQEIFGLDAEVQKRPAMSLGCLCFVLIGCPVGVWFSRGDYLSTFVSCFLPIAGLYYPLGICGFILARKGLAPSVIGMWGADILLALTALFLFRRLLKN